MAAKGVGITKIRLAFTDFFCNNTRHMAAVAQLVEPRIVAPVVEGSSPSGRPKNLACIHKCVASLSFLRQMVDSKGCVRRSPKSEGLELFGAHSPARKLLAFL